MDQYRKWWPHGDIVYDLDEILSGVLFQEWPQIMHIINATLFTHDLDQLTWHWNPKGKYTGRSMYLFF